MATIDVILWEHQANRDGSYPLRLRVTIRRKTTYKSIGYSIEKKHWDKQRKKVKPSHPNSSRLNTLITKKIFEAQNIALEEELKNSSFNVKKMKRKLNGQDNGEFFAFAENYVKKYDFEETRGTYKGCCSIIKKLKDYLGNKPLLFSEIDYQFLDEYRTHLKTIGNNPNTITKNFKRIRSIYNEAVRRKLADNSEDPFADFKMESNKTHKEKLSKEEIDRIRQLNYEKGSLKWHVKNIFLICYNFMGMRIGDALTLQKYKIVEGRLRYSMRKTGDNVSVKLTKEAILILKDYNLDDLKNDEFIFPLIKKNDTSLHYRISCATALYNKYLRLVAADAGVERHISSHVARHSWTQRAKILGINPTIIKESLHHSSLATTQNYMADFDDKVIDDTNQKVVR